jgi:hypothetical protein
MPISATDGCNEQHWAEVRALLSEAIMTAGFQPNLVSDAEDVGIIQKRIIQNLYDNPIVVCDVSGKNPNVMFELGLRLAFDKPTIIVKDDKTSYSFDTAPIEHLTYPRDLRYPQMVAFRAELTRKIQGTHASATNDESYTTFLKHFGTFTVARLNEKEVSRDEALFEELRDLKTMIRGIRRPTTVERRPSSSHLLLLPKAVQFLYSYAKDRKMELSQLPLKREELLNVLAAEFLPVGSFGTATEFFDFTDMVIDSVARSCTLGATPDEKAG